MRLREKAKAPARASGRFSLAQRFQSHTPANKAVAPVTKCAFRAEMFCSGSKPHIPPSGPFLPHGAAERDWLLSGAKRSLAIISAGLLVLLAAITLLATGGTELLGRARGGEHRQMDHNLRR